MKTKSFWQLMNTAVVAVVCARKMKKAVLVCLGSLVSMVSMAQDSLQSEVLYIDSVQVAEEPAPTTLEDSLRTLYASMSSMLQKQEAEKIYDKIWGHRKFFNFGYMFGSMKNMDFNEKLDSEFGFSLSSGRVIYFHKKPIANMLKIGLDAGMDIKIAKYKEQTLDYDDWDDDDWYNDYSWDDDDWDDEVDMHIGYYSVDAGLAIGPSFTVNPVGQLKIKAFFHVIPSYSMLIVDDDVNSSYKTRFTYGGEVTWGRFGLGIEGYTGTAKYKSVMDDVMDNVGGGLMDDYYTPKGKTKFRTSGLNLYLTIKM